MSRHPSPLTPWLRPPQHPRCLSVAPPASPIRSFVTSKTNTSPHELPCGPQAASERLGRINPGGHLGYHAMPWLAPIRLATSSRGLPIPACAAYHPAVDVRRICLCVNGLPRARLRRRCGTPRRLLLPRPLASRATLPSLDRAACLLLCACAFEESIRQWLRKEAPALRVRASQQTRRCWGGPDRPERG